MEVLSFQLSVFSTKKQSLRETSIDGRFLLLGQHRSISWLALTSED